MNQIEKKEFLYPFVYLGDQFALLKAELNRCKPNELITATPNGTESIPMKKILTIGGGFMINAHEGTYLVITPEYGFFVNTEETAKQIPIQARSREKLQLGMDSNGRFYFFKPFDFDHVSRHDLVKLMTESVDFLKLNGRYAELEARLSIFSRLRIQIYFKRKQWFKNRQKKRDERLSAKFNAAMAKKLRPFR